MKVQSAQIQHYLSLESPGNTQSPNVNWIGWTVLETFEGQTHLYERHILTDIDGEISGCVFHRLSSLKGLRFMLKEMNLIKHGFQVVANREKQRKSVQSKKKHHYVCQTYPRELVGIFVGKKKAEMSSK